MLEFRHWSGSRRIFVFLTFVVLAFPVLLAAFWFYLDTYRPTLYYTLRQAHSIYFYGNTAGAEINATIREIRNELQRTKETNNYLAKAFYDLRKKMIAPKMDATKVATWRASDVGPSEATLRGQLATFNGQSEVYFEFGTSKLAMIATQIEKIEMANPRPTHVLRRVGQLKPGTSYFYRLVSITEDGINYGNIMSFSTLQHHAPAVETRQATFRGRTTAVLHGTVNASNLPTKYFFRYGTNKSTLGSSTEPRAVGPVRNACVTFDFDTGPGPWRTYVRWEHKLAGGDNFGFMRYLPRTTKGEYVHLDDHHDAAGLIVLIANVYTGNLSSPGLPSLLLGGGDADLRDARVEIRIRGVDWQSNGTSLVWWIQSYHEYQNEPGKAYWAFTGAPLDKLLEDGIWHTARTEFVADENLWSFAGNNEWDSPGARYFYAPLGRSLAHQNANLHLAALYADKTNYPNGAVDIDEFKICYRNESLLSPLNGARLISWPDSSLEDPLLLTDGWRAGQGQMWNSSQGPTGPQEFVYRFDNVVELNRIILYQNSDWPSQEVMITFSLDGKDFTDAKRVVLPSSMLETGHNGLYGMIDLPGLKTRFVRVSIISGYFEQFWGLGEIEAFGDGARLTPEAERASVSVAVPNLEPGSKVFFQLVAKNAMGETRGEIGSIELPTDETPWARTGPAERPTTTTVRVWGRINPMGREEARFFVEYGKTEDLGLKTLEIDAGRQDTPRHMVVDLEDLESDQTYYYRIVLRNDRGTTFGSIKTFRTAATGTSG